MSDRLSEIRARHNLHKREHEALAKWNAAPRGEKPGRGRGYFVSAECGCGHKWCGTDDEWFPVHFHQGQAYEHALDDIAWLIAEIERLRRLAACPDCDYMDGGKPCAYCASVHQRGAG